MFISNSASRCKYMLLTYKANPGLKAMHKASVCHSHQTSVQLPAHLLQIIYIGQPSLKTLTHMQPLHALLNNMHQVYLCPLVCSISKPGLKRITQMLQAYAKNASLQLETHFNTLLHKTRPVIKRMVHVQSANVHHSTTHPVPLGPPSMTAVHPSHQTHIKCVLSPHISNTVCHCTAMSQSTLLVNMRRPGLKAMHKASVGHSLDSPLELPTHLLQIIYIGQPSLKTLTHMQPLHAQDHLVHQHALHQYLLNIT